MLVCLNLWFSLSVLVCFAVLSSVVFCLLVLVFVDSFDVVWFVPVLFAFVLNVFCLSVGVVDVC